MIITLRQLRDLRAVVEAGSFRAAAKRLNMQQSAISRSIIEFEAGVSGKIFDRRPTGVRLTPLGAVLAPDAIAILNAVEGLLSKARSSSKSSPGHMTIGLDTALPVGSSQLFLAAFNDHFPDVNITLSQHSARQIIAAVGENKIQFGLIRGGDLLSDIPVRRFLVGELLAALPSNWRMDNEAIDSSFLSGQRLHIASDDITATGVSKLHEVLGAKINLTAHECSAAVLVGLVASGMGVGLLTNVPTEAAEMGIRVVPVRPTISVIEISAIWSVDAIPVNITKFLDRFNLTKKATLVPPPSTRTSASLDSEG